MVAAIHRVPYQACPLCDGDFVEEHLHPCARHPLFREGMTPEMRWMRCRACAHVFTDGYWPLEVLELLFDGPHPGQVPGMGDVEADRQTWAPTVERLTTRSRMAGHWLDVGFGNGAAMTTAEEFGHQVVGIDLRAEAVIRMAALGYEVHKVDIEQFQPSRPFDVIIMADVLEHTPFPNRSLAAVKRLLAPGGLLFLSMPNTDSLAWRLLDAMSHPYWGELEHFHNFGRGRLCVLLEAFGLEFVHYAVSRRYVACMEVIARGR